MHTKNFLTVEKVENPMKFHYFVTDDGTSSYLVSRNPIFCTKYAKEEGNLNILGSVTSFGDSFSMYITSDDE